MKIIFMGLILMGLCGPVAWAKCVSTPEQLVADPDFKRLHSLTQRQQYITTDGKTYFQWWKGPSTGKLMMAFKYTGLGAMQTTSSFKICKINGRYSMWVDKTAKRFNLVPSRNGIGISYSIYSSTFQPTTNRVRARFGYGKPPKWTKPVRTIASQQTPVQAPSVETPVLEAPVAATDDSAFDLGVN